jgi:hypothetical protein
MKKIYTIFFAALLTTIIFSQTPQKMSYQALIRDAGNVLVTNHEVGIQISILQGSATGTPVYVETQNPTTNANGLVTIEIGAGTPVTGTFEGIDWSAGPYYIKTETDPAGGTNYTISGTSQLLSVPYALYSKTSGTSPELESLKDFVYSKFPPPTNGLVAYYPFNGNANDESGNGFNGTVNGATLTTDRFNTENSAYSFNGENNFINLGNLGGYSSHSFSGWFKIEGQQDGWGVLVSKLYNDLYFAMNSEIRIDPDYGEGYKVSVQVGTGTIWDGPIMNNTVNSESWHNFVFIYDDNEKTIKVYIDNSLFGSKIVTGYSDEALTPTYIGARPYWNGPTVFFFKGKIDDVRIYNRALNSAEIQSIYHDGGW